MKILKYLIPYIILGSLQYKFTKDGLMYASPMSFMALRYAIGGLVLLPFSRRIILNKDIVILTLLTVTSTALWAYGLTMVAPSESAVLSYTMPLFAIPLSAIILREVPKRLEVMGAVIGFTGVVIYGLSLRGHFSLLGGILTVVNAFFWAAFTVYFRKMRDLDPVLVNTTQLLLGSLVFLALSPLDFRVQFNPNMVEDLLFSAVLGGSVLFYLWNYMVRIERVGKVTVLAFSVPILSSALDVLTGEAQLDSMSVTGMGVMFLGILLSRSKEMKRDVSNLKRASTVK